MFVIIPTTLAWVLFGIAIPTLPFNFTCYIMMMNDLNAKMVICGISLVV